MHLLWYKANLDQTGVDCLFYNQQVLTERIANKEKLRNYNILEFFLMKKSQWFRSPLLCKSHNTRYHPALDSQWKGSIMSLLIARVDSNHLAERKSVERAETAWWIWWSKYSRYKATRSTYLKQINTDCNTCTGILHNELSSIGLADMKSITAKRILGFSQYFLQIVQYSYGD